MKLKDLFKDKGFIMSTNVEVVLMKLLEESGISKKEIMAGTFDMPIARAKEKVFKIFYE